MLARVAGLPTLVVHERADAEDISPAGKSELETGRPYPYRRPGWPWRSTAGNADSA